MNFDNYKFHPSSLGKFMTSSRTKGDLGETCKKALIACYVEQVYGRRKDITNKYIEKGLEAEEDSITLYSRVTKKFHKKNEEVIVNDFFVGTPDLFDGESIYHANTIIDIKTSWDIHTFFNTIVSPINKDYWWQGQAYMDLTGAKTFKLVYCLVNTPLVLIEQEKNRLLYQMGVTTRENELYLEACEKLERELTFDDIPLKDRYISFEIKRDDAAIAEAKDKLRECREYLNLLYTSQNHELILA